MAHPTYLLTIKMAPAGTPVHDDGKGKPGFSTAGHMWVEVGTTQGSHMTSLGFGPIQHGKAVGPGKVFTNDSTNYHGENALGLPIRTVTLQVTRAQAEQALAFAKDPASQKFDMKYNAATNSCVDFTWKTLEVMGINPQRFQGLVAPASNHPDAVRWAQKIEQSAAQRQGLAQDRARPHPPAADAGRGNAHSYQELLVGQTGAGRGQASSYDPLLVAGHETTTGTAHPTAPATGPHQTLARAFAELHPAQALAQFPGQLDRAYATLHAASGQAQALGLDRQASQAFMTHVNDQITQQLAQFGPGLQQGPTVQPGHAEPRHARHPSTVEQPSPRPQTEPNWQM